MENGEFLSLRIKLHVALQLQISMFSQSIGNDDCGGYRSVVGVFALRGLANKSLKFFEFIRLALACVRHSLP